MERTRLAALLVDASNDAEIASLLDRYCALADAQLGYLLKDICLEGWSSHPARALGAARSLKSLSQLRSETEISALTEWAEGLQSLIEGTMVDAISHLDNSRDRFLALENHHQAASTQVSKLVALATLGKYDDAIECGLQAREVLLEIGDLSAAGKIEHNIGNIFFRRDRYHEAEEYQWKARTRFLQTGDELQIAKVENSLALTLSQQHKVGPAEALYERALRGAEKAGIVTTQAAIESSIGMLALYQGQYDRALDFLERARRKYVELNLPNLAATTEQEIADAYLEMNLLPEAAQIYERVSRDFARLGMRAEEARALAYHGRAEVVVGDRRRAAELLARSHRLYQAEGNQLGAAFVQLIEAQLNYANREYDTALYQLTQIETVLLESGDRRRSLWARWLRGEATRSKGEWRDAETILSETLQRAQEDQQNEIVWRCLNSLGLAAAAQKDAPAAENYFRLAVRVIEELRAPLPAEEFRTAFLADKLRPYQELVRLNLSNGRVAEAFAFSEQGRSRALADALTGGLPLALTARDSFEADLLKQLDQVRGELNYFYNQLEQQNRKPFASRDGLDLVQQEIRGRENRSLQISRQLQHRGRSQFGRRVFESAELQRALGENLALIEYGAIDQEQFVFIATDKSIDVVCDLGSTQKIVEDIARFRFQIEALRSGAQEIRKHLPQLNRRAQKYLRSLYDTLVRPLETFIGSRDLLVVPHGQLNYLPFHALHNGERYLIEDREVSYAPSAVVWQQCAAKPISSLNSGLLVGVSDERLAAVDREVATLSSIFKNSEVLVDDGATITSLRSKASKHDVLHLACHAHFRPDNPFFSALKLSDGWLTVRDAYNLKLNSVLVTLSACETGLSKVGNGEELIGLARGFLSAGSPSVVLSLWTVDDESTAMLMTDFYRELITTMRPAAAMRKAQLSMLEHHDHPFFWSPFVVIGKG